MPYVAGLKVMMRIVVDQLVKEVALDDYRMQALVTAVVTQLSFTHRRIK